MLTDKDIRQWKECGFVVVQNLPHRRTLDECVKLVNATYYNEATSPGGFGSANGEFEFPCENILDWLTLDHRLILAAKQLLGTTDILLVQSDVWGKYGTRDRGAYKNSDQRMHMDYGNNMFLHPNEWRNPEAVSAIIYLSDTAVTGGGTAVVPRRGPGDPVYKPPYVNMPGQAGLPFFNDRSHAEESVRRVSPETAAFREKLYDREIILCPNVGDILFYRLDVWHRGTPVRAGHVRNVMNLMWKKKVCSWTYVWNSGWAKKMYYGTLEDLFVRMSPIQRQILGVPGPGHVYWTWEKLKHLKARYPKLDTRPYLSKL